MTWALHGAEAVVMLALAVFTHVLEQDERKGPPRWWRQMFIGAAMMLWVFWLMRLLFAAQAWTGWRN